MNDPAISNEHATVWWENNTWWVRDLGSRNGTFVDGRRLDVGEVARLAAGSTLGLGRPLATWSLGDSYPPHAVAVRAHDNAEQHAHGGLIALPSPEDPQVTVCQNDQGWSCESESGSRDVVTGDQLDVGGELWTLELPEEMDRTKDTEAIIGSVDLLRLHFRVSPDEEMVQIIAACLQSTWELEARSYHYLLLTLARQRLQDREEGLPPPAEGWVDAKELARMLRVAERTLTVHIYRARRQLGDLGISGSGKLIERRGRTGQLRLAVSRIEVERLGES